MALIHLTYEELLEGESNDVLAKIEEGFGAAGLGIVTVSGVPGLPALRQQLLTLADAFADLPDDVKQLYRDPTGGLSGIGWSHGIEALQSGKPDTYKGSYYANPLHDKVTDDPDLIRRHPSYCSPNIWPEEHLPQLRTAFRGLGGLIIQVGLLLAQHCDRYVAACRSSMPPGKLTQVIRDSPNPKGRLLHYFPPSVSDDGNKWCGWHTDHGSLTGLTSALYTAGGKEVPSPDPSAGLYIRNREGKVVKGTIPPTHIAFQMGEAMQVHSGGLLRATPHYVQSAKGPAAVGVSRNTFAVFMQPKWDVPMDIPPGVDAQNVGIGQWQPGISFGEFSELTVKNYHHPES